MFCRLIFGLSLVPLGPSTRSLRTEASVERQSFPRVKICHPSVRAGPLMSPTMSHSLGKVSSSIAALLSMPGSVARATVSDCLSALCECLQSRCRVLDHECESVGRENVGACESVRLDGTDFGGLLWRGAQEPAQTTGCQWVRFGSCTESTRTVAEMPAGSLI
jgi:hypothetical protein